MIGLCNFVVIPADGRAPYVVPFHPHPDRVSDVLDAVPAPVVGAHPTAALWVRETAAVEGQQRNLVASLLLRVLTGPSPEPVLGPAVLTRIEAVPMNGSPMLAMVAEGFPAEVADRLVQCAGDIRRALDGYEDGFNVGHPAPGLWAASIRKAAGRDLELPITEDWPRGMPAPPPGADGDVVAEVLARLGLGQVFVHVPIPGVTA